MTRLWLLMTTHTLLFFQGGRFTEFNIITSVPSVTVPLNKSCGKLWIFKKLRYPRTVFFLIKTNLALLDASIASIMHGLCPRSWFSGSHCYPFYLVSSSWSLLFSTVQNSDDLGDVGKRVGVSSPFLVVCQTSEGSTMHVIVEQEPMCNLPVFGTVLIHLVGSYFLYNIEYPKALKSLLLMIQHHILSIPDKQKDPTNVVEIVTSLKRMDSQFSTWTLEPLEHLYHHHKLSFAAIIVCNVLFTACVVVSYVYPRGTFFLHSSMYILH